MAFSQEYITISQAIDGYLDVVDRARSENTLSTYANALNFLSAVLDEHDLPPAEASVDQLNENVIKKLA